MLNITRCDQDRRLFHAATGMTFAEFTTLLPEFEAALKQPAQTKRAPRQRQEGGGRKHTLATGQEKLFFYRVFRQVLCHLRRPRVAVRG